MQLIIKGIELDGEDEKKVTRCVKHDFDDETNIVLGVCHDLCPTSLAPKRLEFIILNAFKLGLCIIAEKRLRHVIELYNTEDKNIKKLHSEFRRFKAEVDHLIDSKFEGVEDAES